MNRFEDHFSHKAREYARYRPGYPAEMFAYLATLAPHRRLAWDCGTGSGQAALGLAEHFDLVVATDASAEQLAQASPHPQIQYRQERAEQVSVETGSAGLVTVALAVHWFDLDAFYREVRRTLSPGGVLAVWCYHFPIIEPELDRILVYYDQQVVHPYWPERFHYLEEHYRTLPFPFDELDSPAFEMLADWDLAHLLGFLDSWSATRRYEAERGDHPLKQIWEELSRAWGDPERQVHIRWPLYLRIGSR